MESVRLMQYQIRKNSLRASKHGFKGVKGEPSQDRVDADENEHVEEEEGTEEEEHLEAEGDEHAEEGARQKKRKSDLLFRC